MLQADHADNLFLAEIDVLRPVLCGKFKSCVKQEKSRRESVWTKPVSV